MSSRFPKVTLPPARPLMNRWQVQTVKATFVFRQERDAVILKRLEFGAASGYDPELAVGGFKTPSPLLRSRSITRLCTTLAMEPALCGDSHRALPTRNNFLLPICRLRVHAWFTLAMCYAQYKPKDNTMTVFGAGWSKGENRQPPARCVYDSYFFVYMSIYLFFLMSNIMLVVVGTILMVACVRVAIVRQSAGGETKNAHHAPVLDKQTDASESGGAAEKKTQAPVSAAPSADVRNPHFQPIGDFQVRVCPGCCGCFC